MKQPDNNDMEILLRGLARHEGRSAGAAGTTSEDQLIGAHLDADELSSYAEQVLPSLTRARYTAHLADCSTCRTIVAQLTLSSGVKVQAPVAAPEIAGGFWQRIRAFMSPAVLRYAVPAVVLLAVVGVSLVALRQSRPGSEFVARQQQATSEGFVDQSPQVSTDSAAKSAGAPNVSANRETPTQAPTGLTEKNRKAGEDSHDKLARLEAEQAPATPRRDEAKSETAVTVAQPTYAPEPAPPPAAKPQSTQGDVAAAEVAKRKEPAEKDAREQQDKAGERARAEDRENRQAKSTDANRPATSGRGLSTLSTGQTTSAGAKKADDDAEARSVSGRRFRKQRGVWMDTAYQSSASTTTVVRGSEQYRALVADEPGIRTIAEQLPGEIVLVWKGRAYRIR